MLLKFEIRKRQVARHILCIQHRLFPTLHRSPCAHIFVFMYYLFETSQETVVIETQPVLTLLSSQKHLRVKVQKAKQVREALTQAVPLFNHTIMPPYSRCCILRIDGDTPAACAGLQDSTPHPSPELPASPTIMSM